MEPISSVPAEAPAVAVAAEPFPAVPADPPAVAVDDGPTTEPSAKRRKKTEPDAWESERSKLAQWEQTGALPKKAPLSHLAKFLGKETAGPAAAAAKEASALEAVRRKAQLEAEAAQRKEQQEAEAARRKVQSEADAERRRAAAAAAKEEADRRKKEDEADWEPRLHIPDPVFEDHDNPSFLCDVCKEVRPREVFSSDVLLQLNDCSELRAAGEDPEEGPWRGIMKSIHPRGFGFVTCKRYQELYGGDRKDVFMLASLVERVVGGKRFSMELAKESEIAADIFRHNIRVQFTIQKQQQDGKPGAKEAKRIELVCKRCARKREERRVQNEAEKRRRAAGLPAPPKPPAKVQNVKSMLAKLHSALGLPPAGPAQPSRGATVEALRSLANTDAVIGPRKK